MKPSSESKWTVDDARDLYNLDRWGCGFFDIDDVGRVTVDTDTDYRPVAILTAIDKAERQGLTAPFILRFPDIIRQRINQINSAFRNSIRHFNYAGSYQCFYPAKVNQHREVIQAAIDAGRRFYGGVEAGSKAELLAMLLMTDEEIPILVNGFKDHLIVEMAFRAIQLGRNIIIIIEKLNELDLVVECIQRFGIRPCLGVRVKLAARSGGLWNASVGLKSKFGMTTSQLNHFVDQLQQFELLDCLKLLHFHPGSQISNIRKIKSSLIEAARIYADLVQLGVPLDTIDVGGGLAVDYTGQRNSDPSSMNYTLEEYANDVIYYIQQVCRQSGVCEPNIISESGRAITAHHSLLVMPVLKMQDASHDTKSVNDAILESTPVLKELKDILDAIHPRNLSESYHDAQNAIETVWQLFSHGTLTLKQRSCAESLVATICRAIAGRLDELDFVPRELNELRHRLADTYIANFSLFQALPDSWAIGQVFPVVPVHRLNERPNRRGVIGDITCDSDGTINCFVGTRGDSKSLPLHDPGDNPYYLGVFLMGAYQEALSDDHNLMGNFNVISVANDGSIELRPGATTMDVLNHVHHPKQVLKDSLKSMLADSEKNERILNEQRIEIESFFETIFDSYTYLQPRYKSQPGAPSLPHFNQRVGNHSNLKSDKSYEP